MWRWTFCIAGPRSEINNKVGEQKKERNERTDKWRYIERLSSTLKYVTAPSQEVSLANANEQSSESALFLY